MHHPKPLKKGRKKKEERSKQTLKEKGRKSPNRWSREEIFLRNGEQNNNAGIKRKNIKIP